MPPSSLPAPGVFYYAKRVNHGKAEVGMVDWVGWLVAAGVLIVLEMFTGTFYLLMIGLGLAVGGLAALASHGPAVQFLAAAVVGIVATLMLRRSRIGRGGRSDATRDPNVNLDIGQTVFIDAWTLEGGRHIARVKYRGADWDIELEHGEQAVPGSFVIRQIRGSRFIVANAASHRH